jgi:hypothetical protein
MLNSNTLDNEIRETFYNTILCVAMENNIGPNELNGLNRLQLLANIVCTTLKKFRESSQIGFVTIKGTHVTTNNVPEYFREVYLALEQTKSIKNNDQLYIILRQITTKVMSKDLFTNIIRQVIDFYKDAYGLQQDQQSTNQHESGPETNAFALRKYIRNPNENPMLENIRQTFYDIMMESIQHVHDIMPPEDVVNFEPYVAIGMPSLSIISNVVNSMGTNGIKLLNGDILTVEKCPAHKDLIKKLFAVKQLFIENNLSNNQLIFLQYKCINNPDKEMPNEYKQYDSPTMNNIVSKIIDIALDISRLYNFKQNIMRFLN